MILVTGANKGIGFEIVKELLKDNNKIIAVSKSIDNLELINNENLIVYQCDLNYLKNLNNLFDYIQNNDYEVDTLINNAGIGCFGKIESFSLNDWNQIINLNLTVPFLLIREFCVNMKKNNAGRIINICSDASYLGFDEAAAYCASKHGLLGLGKALNFELKKYGIQVNSICPGRVDTYFNKKKPGDRPNSLKAIDIAKLVVELTKCDKRCNIEQINLSSNYE